MFLYYFIKKIFIFLPFNYHLILVLTIELQNRESVDIQLSQPFIFDHQVVLVGDFDHVDNTWRWVPPVSSSFSPFPPLGAHHHVSWSAREANTGMAAAQGEQQAAHHVVRVGAGGQHGRDKRWWQQSSGEVCFRIPNLFRFPSRSFQFVFILTHPHVSST